MIGQDLPSCRLDEIGTQGGKPCQAGSVQDLAVDGITTDGTQSRAKISDDVVEEYAAAMREGTKLPPLDVFTDGKNYWLADGFHRFFAALRCEKATIRCHVRQGGKREALKYSLGANSNHGLRRTNEDKRRAVELALSDEEWRKLSDRAIAEMCGVSNTFVGNVRESLEVVQVSTVDTSANVPNSLRRGRDGKLQPGAKRKKASDGNSDALGKSTESAYDGAPTSEATARVAPSQLESRKASTLELISQLRRAMEELDLLEEVDRWLEQMDQLVHAVE